MLILKTDNGYVNFEHVVRIFVVSETDSWGLSKTFSLTAELDNGENIVLSAFDDYNKLRYELSIFEGYLNDENEFNESRIFNFSRFLTHGSIDYDDNEIELDDAEINEIESKGDDF